MIMKKVYRVVAAIAFLTCLAGNPYLFDGISARGRDGAFMAGFCFLS